MKVRDRTEKELGLLVDVKPSLYLLTAWELEHDPFFSNSALSQKWLLIPTYREGLLGTFKDGIFVLAHRSAE